MKRLPGVQGKRVSEVLKARVEKTEKSETSLQNYGGKLRKKTDLKSHLLRHTPWEHWSETCSFQWQNYFWDPARNSTENN